MNKARIVLIIICIAMSGCDYFSDAKKLVEQLTYYKSQCAYLNDQLGQAQQELEKAYEEIKRLNIDIDKMKAEIERFKNLHKKMME